MEADEAAHETQRERERERGRKSDVRLAGMDSHAPAKAIEATSGEMKLLRSVLDLR